MGSLLFSCLIFPPGAGWDGFWVLFTKLTLTGSASLLSLWHRPHLLLLCLQVAGDADRLSQDEQAESEEEEEGRAPNSPGNSGTHTHCRQSLAFLSGPWPCSGPGVDPIGITSPLMLPVWRVRAGANQCELIPGHHFRVTHSCFPGCFGATFCPLCAVLWCHPCTQSWEWPQSP